MSHADQFKKISELNTRIKNELSTSIKADHSLKNEYAGCPSKAISCKLPVTISIRKKIGFNESMYDADKLTDEQAFDQVKRILLILRMQHIHLLFDDITSNPKDVYRFIAYDFLDIELPPHPDGMQFCFVYDQVRNEHVKDPELLVRRVFEPLFQLSEKSNFHHLSNRVKLNAFDNLSEPELHYVVDRHHQRHENILSRGIKIETKKLMNNRLFFSGSHQTVLCNSLKCDIINGKWELELIPIQGTWRVVNIQIGGIDFGF